MDSKEIRRRFLEFFKSKGHTIVPSAPIILRDDPTLMFSNSGMTQFKDFFLGYKIPDHKKVVDTQKCLRVSGKHNDLDDVGKDTYHHTMFEMLGNWSFGDYFKKEAISWAWELLTEVYKISKENLYVTVFEGDVTDGLERDEEAYQYWNKFLSKDRILNGSKKDNFWEMGETGPCGPCSEIHIDIRSKEEKSKIPGKDLINKDHPQVIEIWNIVFMEFFRKSDRNLEKLPKKNIDTGMGFERLCMVLQDKTSNYDTDIFSPLIKKLEIISNLKYKGTSNELDIAFRVAVDHIRAVSFAIADGQLPSNNGAGYVIRRILRRAISYVYRFLNLKEPSLYKLVPILEDQMGEFFPEIVKEQKLIVEVVKEEENNFLRTIEQGLIRLKNFISTNKNSNEIPGEIIFELYDTYGFPSDLSRIIAEENKMTIDEIGFEKEMLKQKERSKLASHSKTEDWVVINEELSEGFIGYDFTETQIKINRYRKIENKEGIFYQLVFQITPFFAESGGQVGDTGVIKNENEEIEIIDTKKENNLIIHITKKLPQFFEFPFVAIVDNQRRKDITRNHSATHLLHRALREIIGKHVEQKGSYVGPDYLRFDFSHFNKLTDEELLKVSEWVNKRIMDRIPLEEFREVPIKEAIDKGAMALFGEKYGNIVRVIKFADSIELCGGCHVQNTGEIITFTIISESSISAGIRRIEAITGNKALEFYKDNYYKHLELIKILNNPKDPIKTIEKLYLQISELKNQVEYLNKEKATQLKEKWKESFIDKNGIKVLKIQSDLEQDYVKDIIFQLKNEVSNSVILIINDNEKILLSLGISDDIIKMHNLNAGSIIKVLAKEIRGGGGGQASFATAGGTYKEGIEAVLNKLDLLL